MEERIPQLEAMRMGVAYQGIIKIRGFNIAVRPLSSAEWVQLMASVSSYMKSIPEDARNKVTEEIKIAKETLILASTSDVGVRDQKITELILDRMTIGELLALFKEYNDFVESVDPSLDNMTKDQVQELVDLVKKNPNAVMDLSRWQLQIICRLLLTNDG